MPAYLTHKLACTAALKEIQDPVIKTIVTGHMPEYLSGAQGTDFVYFDHFYFLPISYKTKIYGWLQHRARPSQYLVCAAEYLKEHYSDRLMAYFCGFLSHYCLDKYVHAHVYRDTKNISTHTYLEQALDVMYASQYFHMDARNVNRKKELLHLITDEEEINAFHEHMAARIYDGYRLPPNALRRCYTWWSRAMRSTYRPSRAKRFWLRVVNVFLSFDIYAFIYKKKEEVQGLHDYPKYFRAIEKANTESARYMELVLDYIRGNRHVSVLESTFYNVSCMGSPVLPLEERRSFRRMYRRAPTVK
jgi:hypothetical protein